MSEKQKYEIHFNLMNTLKNDVRQQKTKNNEKTTKNKK